MMDSTQNAPQPESYDFVGGPYDGRRMPVDPPPDEGMELVVHSVGVLAPAEFYVLRSDGRFHYEAPSQPWPAALSGV